VDARATGEASTVQVIESAVAALGDSPLTAGSVARHIAPLFSRVLAAQSETAYLANHSLGRPLDVTARDVLEAVTLWQSRMGEAWDSWHGELGMYRARLAALLGAARADSVVPKTSAGQGLRAVLNAFDGSTPARVVATRAEFDSLDVILRHYAQRGRIQLTLVPPRTDGTYAADDIVGALGGRADLLVVSQVLFTTGQVLPDLPRLVSAARRAGAKVLLDVYHSLGVLPLAVGALDVDFAVGGSYKYLRGGPGACFLYVHPRHLDGSWSTLDIGWFAKRERFAYQRPDPPQWAPGGDALLESTPPILTWYQARAGQVFTNAVGVGRLRTYTQALQRDLVGRLAAKGIAASGGDDAHGAFCVVEFEAKQARSAPACVAALNRRGVIADARGPWLRLCPDLLTTDEDLDRAAAALAAALGG
jgi:kynureninase